MSERVERRARAKVNLCLSVASPEPLTAPRAGWHRVASWIHAIDLHDTVVLSALAPGRASILERVWSPDAPRPAPIDWPEEQDLAMRALRLLERHAGRLLPTRIRIEKRVPPGGGLGGGSSDAAAVLLAANDLHRLGLSVAQLADLGARLGSDVPFFIDERADPRPALVASFGERIERLEPLPGSIDLAIPGFACPTADVYAALDRLRGESAARADEARVRRCIEVARRHGLEGADLFNDLSEPACVVQPRLAELIARLRSRGWRRVHVTGSGSCVFRPAVNTPPMPSDDFVEGVTILRVGLV